jgi:hypothetical protein
MLIIIFLFTACGKGEPLAVKSRLRILDSTHLRLTLPGGLVNDLVPADFFQVSMGGKGDHPLAVQEISWFREISQADPTRGVFQTAQQCTLTLGSPLAQNEVVRVVGRGLDLSARFESQRISPVFHTNRYGYDLAGDKRARVGLYLGTGGELPLKGGTFQVIEADTGRSVLQGDLRRTPEQGYFYQPAPNQSVWSADFPDLAAGRYQLEAPGLGRSEIFQVRAGTARESARLYAQGMYNQRCGEPLLEGFSERVRPACHLAVVNNLGRPVIGGHHDAADYGRYTYNAAMTAHLYLFAIECLPKFGFVDDLRLPESGDQIPDLLQIALRDLSLISSMQAEDGRFYSRLRPRDRAYDTDKPADQADPQKASPGNSVSTAVAVAVLAQAARCDELRNRFPDQARRFREQALKGWKALQGLKFEKTDHHYGQLFEDKDELAWALVELYLLTGEDSFQSQLIKRLEPEQKALRHWGWLPAHEGWGCAARSYVLSKTPARPRDPNWQTLLRQELLAAGDLWLDASRSSAYGSTFPKESKRHQTAGWFFPHDGSFDLVVAWQIQSREEIRAAVWSNWNYELGVNPKDLAFLTGAGALWPKHTLHGIANTGDPPHGIPIGSMVSGPRGYPEIGKAQWPELVPGPSGMPLDQRWGDYPNVLSEATVVSQTRGLLSCLWLTQSESPAASLQARPRSLLGYHEGTNQWHPASNNPELKMQAGRIHRNGAVP